MFTIWVIFFSELVFHWKTLVKSWGTSISAYQFMPQTEGLISQSDLLLLSYLWAPWINWFLTLSESSCHHFCCIFCIFVSIWIHFFQLCFGFFPKRKQCFLSTSAFYLQSNRQEHAGRDLHHEKHELGSKWNKQILK